LKNISAAANQWDWSDDSYLNDPKSIEMANRGDLRCVFQYDSDGIRKLVRKGGVENFDDLVAYVSLYRPSTLQMGMDETYCLRKRGRQEYEIPEVLERVLRKTHGVMLYQEQVMQILSIVGKIPLRDCYQVIKAISKKKIEGFKKHKDKFVENGQQTLGKTSKEMEEYWQLIESFAGYGFNLSHATAYSVISARQLYLKAHYPLEFYAATLMCEQDDSKLREYITEAENHDVQVCNLDLNKSKDNFSIQDGKIYVGFSNVKGIGEEKAKKIVDMQPYAGFEDFLLRFGVEANVLRALIPLRIFNEAEPEILYKFWMAYSEYTKKCKDKQKRFEASCKKIIEEALSIDSSASKDNNDIDIAIINNIRTTDVLKADLLEACRKKLVKTKTRNVTTALQAPSMSEFKAEEYDIEDKDVLSLLRDKEKAQLTYFGFVWENELKTLPDYVKERNFDNFIFSSEQGAKIGVVLVKVLAVNVKKFKNNKGQFVSLHVMDDSFQEGRITVWDDDYQRFKDEMKAGNYISIQITPPSGGFPSYTFYSPPRHERYKLPKDKTKDFRLLVLRKA
jgi:DNA polymerase III alpha subunit